jgi:hypothetical protein
LRANLPDALARLLTDDGDQSEWGLENEKQFLIQLSQRSPFSNDHVESSSGSNLQVISQESKNLRSVFIN